MVDKKVLLARAMFDTFAQKNSIGKDAMQQFLKTPIERPKIQGQFFKEYESIYGRDMTPAEFDEIMKPTPSYDPEPSYGGGYTDIGESKEHENWRIQREQQRIDADLKRQIRGDTGRAKFNELMPKGIDTQRLPDLTSNPDFIGRGEDTILVDDGRGSWTEVPNPFKQEIKTVSSEGIPFSYRRVIDEIKPTVNKSDSAAKIKTIDNFDEYKKTDSPYYRDMQLVPIESVWKYKEFDRVKEPGGMWGREELKKDIEKNGIKEAIILDVDRNGNAVISEGNNRLEIAKELGIDVIPVKVMRRKNIEKWSEKALPINKINIPESAYYPLKSFETEYWLSQGKDIKDFPRDLKATMSPTELGMKTWNRDIERQSISTDGIPFTYKVMEPQTRKTIEEIKPSDLKSVVAPDKEGRFLRGDKVKGKNIYQEVQKHPDIPIYDGDRAEDIIDAVEKGKKIKWLDPTVVDDKRQALRYKANKEGMYGNEKMQYANPSFQQGRNTYDAFGCGRGEYCRANELDIGACYSREGSGKPACYASVIGKSKGRDVATGESTIGLRKESDLYKTIKDYWESHGRDIEATRSSFKEYAINFYPASSGKGENFSVGVRQAPRGARVFAKLQNAKGQDIRLGVDTDGGAWLSDKKVLDALNKSDIRTLSVYSSAYHKPPQKHSLQDKTIINVTVSGWHPLPETIARLEWAKQARDNGWNVILRPVTADPVMFPDDAPRYNRINKLVDSLDFYYMEQPLHVGVNHGNTVLDGGKVPKCCKGSKENPQTCESCDVAEGTGLGFRDYWEKRGGQKFDDAPIFKAVPEFRKQQEMFLKRK
jgi:hypothetical protein